MPTENNTSGYDFTPQQLYRIFLVTIQLRERLYGGVPKNPELIKNWIAARTGYNDELTAAQTKEALETIVESEAEKSWCGFQADAEKGFFIPTRNMKALMRETATVLRITEKKRGSKQIIQHAFEVKAEDGTDRIYLGRTKPDGMEEKPIHVVTPQGPRTALRRSEFVENVKLTFQIWVLDTDAAEKRHITEEDLVQMLRLAQEDGVGASRSQGYGKFDVVEFKRVR